MGGERERDVVLRCLDKKGPNEITVFVPEVLPAVNGRDNPCSKTAWYDFLLPEVAMNTTRDKQAHDQRRRVWDHAFSFKGSSRCSPLHTLGIFNI